MSDVPPSLLNKDSGQPNRIPEEETDLWVGSYSGKAMYSMWVMLVPITVLIIAGTIWGMTFDLLKGKGYYVWLITALVLVIAWGIPIGKLAYKKVSLKYRLTTQRLIHSEGFFSRSTDQIELIDVEDVNYQQTLFGRMFGVGSITIESTDRSHSKLTMDGIDKVREINDLIDKTRRDERMKKTHHVRGS